MQRVIYRNLKFAAADSRKWSLAEVKGDHGRGTVLGYAASAVLANVRFIASESGSRRIRRSGNREVVAWCVGDIVDAAPAGLPEAPIAYNPKERCDVAFTVRGTARVVTGAAYVRFNADGTATALGVVR